jgi:hypothetical protein
MKTNTKTARRTHAFRMKAVLLVLGLAHFATVAGTLQNQAEMAAAADAVTTIGGAALGAAEANPLGIVTLLAKVPLLAYVKTLPLDEQAEWHATYGAFWGGAAANNLCIIGAILTGGALAPLCPVAGVAWGFKEWNASAMERELWAICREERAYWNNPQMPCDFFKKPSTSGERINQAMTQMDQQNTALVEKAVVATQLFEEQIGTLNSEGARAR